MKLFILMVIYLVQSIESFFSDPDVIHTIIAGIIILFGLAHLFRVDRVKGLAWLVSPASSRQREWLNTIGEKWYSILMGSIYTLSGLLLFYLMYWI